MSLRAGAKAFADHSSLIITNIEPCLEALPCRGMADIRSSLDDPPPALPAPYGQDL